MWGGLELRVTSSNLASGGIKSEGGAASNYQGRYRAYLYVLTFLYICINRAGHSKRYVQHIRYGQAPSST